MLFRLFASLCLPLLAFASSGTLSIENPPAWVVPCDFSMEPIPVKPSQKNLQYLLIDTQRNWPEKTTYKHYAIKVLTQAGVDDISQITISFEPSFRSLKIHGIYIIRNGEILDRLESAEHHLIQQEAALDFGIYTGDLTAVYLLNDVRVGDIVEYAYSFVGENPLFTTHFTDIFYVERQSTVEKYSYRLLTSPDHDFEIQKVNTSLEPTITDLSPGVREWWWQINETPVRDRERDDPTRGSSSSRIEMSDYLSWEEVGEKFSPLFELPEDFIDSCPQEMLDLTSSWMEMTDEPTEQALLALRFVQDQVRYLGLEEGVGGFQPRDPRAVFEKRFGDCKDKSRLLQTLLYLMNIRSTPLLVHSHRGALIPDMMPTPFAFNHAVLQIEIDENVFYVDPTIQFQGGSLENNCFPTYDNGLLLSLGRSQLISLPAETMNKPMEIATTFRIITRESAEYSTTTTCYGSSADAMRMVMDAYGTKKFGEIELDSLRTVYGGAQTISPLSITDDRLANCFQISSSYTIPLRTKAKGKILKLSSSLIDGFLDSNMHPERKSAYAISYPLWVKEHVHVENPFGSWTPSSDSKTYEHPSLFFSQSQEFGETSADYYFELKHLRDLVSQSDLLDYWNICQEIEENAPEELMISAVKRYFLRSQQSISHARRGSQVRRHDPS